MRASRALLAATACLLAAGGVGAADAYVAVPVSPKAVTIGPAHEPSSGGQLRRSAVQGAARLVANVSVGDRPLGVGVNSTTNLVYVTNNYDSTVSVIDGATNALVATIDVGYHPFYHVSVDSSSNRIYVTNNGSGELSVIDGATDSVITTVAGLSGAPEGVAVDPSRNRVYVTRTGTSLTAIDKLTGSIVGTLSTGAFNHSVAVNPVTDRAYVSKSSPGALAMVDLATFTYMGDIAATGHPAVDLSTNRIYLADFSGPRVIVLDGASHARLAEIELPIHPLLLAINSDTRCLYTSHPWSREVTVVDMVHNVVLGSIEVGREPSGIAVNEQINRVYVANASSDTVSVLDGAECGGAPIATETAPASATATATATAAPTTEPSATTTAVAEPTSVTAPWCVCDVVRARVPPAMVADALANPGRFYGWRLPLNPSVPIGPGNPLRECLSLQNVAVDYHPLWNRPQWRAGCP